MFKLYKTLNFSEKFDLLSSKVTLFSFTSVGFVCLVPVEVSPTLLLNLYLSNNFSERGSRGLVPKEVTREGR